MQKPATVKTVAGFSFIYKNLHHVLSFVVYEDDR
jgi:hypothetical protein